MEARARALGLPFDCGRICGATTKLRSVQTYGRGFASTSRMASASLETFKTEHLDGRIFVDLLRLASTKYKDEFHTASFGEMGARLLGRACPKLSPTTVVSLGREGGLQGLRKLAQLCQEESVQMLDLLSVSNTLPDTLEMARVTGLSLQDILYKAEMVKVHSMLLRVAHCHERRYILPSTHVGNQISEGAFKIDPVQANTKGFYPEAQGAIAVCDFQSLYPSVIIAQNLCYTTLLRDSEDIDMLGQERCCQAPGGGGGGSAEGTNGSWFCVSTIQQGLFPMMLQHLLTLRKAAKSALKEPNLSALEALALDARQRALKLCANAAYGFAGAATSPVQSVPLAEAVLLHGAAMCRRAVALASDMSMMNALELEAEGIGPPRVLYAQTDSIFVLLPRASLQQARVLGERLAEKISLAINLPPVKLNFETALSNMLLQAINRYANLCTLQCSFEYAYTFQHLHTSAYESTGMLQRQRRAHYSQRVSRQTGEMFVASIVASPLRRSKLFWSKAMRRKR